MKTFLTAVLVAATLTVPAAAHTQDVDARVRWPNPALRILESYTLKAGDEVRQVLVIAGDATIEGRVDEDVVVIAGKAQLSATALIEGSFLVIGGTAAIAEGAQVRRDVVVVGGLEAPSSFSAGGNQIVVGTAALGAQLRAIVPWITRGLLWGRLIVPGLGWVWTVAVVFFLINLFLSVVFHTPVRASAATLAATPLSAFMTGLLVLLLAGPVCVVLAISVIGIAIIPFLGCALLVAAVIGKIGFARWIGMSVVRQDDMENRAQSLRSFLIGSAIMCIAYIIPVLGFLMWGMGAVFGLGAATLAFFSAYRRENPKPPKKRPIAAPIAVAAEPGPVDLPAPVDLSAPVDLRGPADLSAPVERAAAVTEDPIATEPPIERAAPNAGLLSFPRATFLERLAAFALDVALVMIAAQILRLDRLFAENPSLESNVLLLALVYHIGFWSWKGTTVGGIICQLRLTRIDGTPLRFAESLVRGLSGIFSLAVVGLGFFWILRDPERQAWHDRIAGTYVVKVPRSWPI
jgi:uncharacterized RDD family membrane protein YckC